MSVSDSVWVRLCGQSQSPRALVGIGGATDGQHNTPSGGREASRARFVEQLHSRGVFWRIHGGRPGGDAGSPAVGLLRGVLWRIRFGPAAVGLGDTLKVTCHTLIAR